MVKHIVMWTVKATEQTRQENIQKMKIELMRLPELINEIKGYEIGVNSVDSAAAYDVVLISEFASWQDLDVYRNHAEHVKVAQFINGVRDKVAVVDYEK